MEKEEIRIEAPFAVAGVTLVLVVKARLNCWPGKGRLSIFGIKQPVSVVVVTPQAKRAFRVSGEEMSLGQLTEEVPGIREALEGI
jgi:hypothetical protein